MAGFIRKLAETTGVGAINKATREERQRLKEAERQEKTIRKTMDAELAPYRQAVSAAQTEYTTRVTNAERALTRLENPGTGVVVASLGEVTLFEHSIAVRGETFDLADIDASAQLTPSSALLQVRLPDGQTRLERYSTEWRDVGDPTFATRDEGSFTILESSQERQRDYAEEQVIAIANEINNQVLWHKRFVQEAPALIPPARQELEVQTADNRALVAMQQSLIEAEEKSVNRARLNDARDLVARLRLEYHNARRRFEGLPEVDHIGHEFEAPDEEVESEMRDEPGQVTTAAWHPDPLGRFELRYWDGEQWTEHVSINGVTASDPPTQ